MLFVREILDFSCVIVDQSLLLTKFLIEILNALVHGLNQERLVAKLQFEFEVFVSIFSIFEQVQTIFKCKCVNLLFCL